jgi:hypothetical protein
VRDRNDRDARLALGRVEQSLRVERLAVHPGRETGRRDEIVQLHRELRALLPRQESLEIERAELVEGRLLNGLDERSHVERQAGPPRAFEDVGEQDVLARLERIRVDAQQAQQPGHDRSHAVAQRTGVRHQLG